MYKPQLNVDENSGAELPKHGRANAAEQRALRRQRLVRLRAQAGHPAAALARLQPARHEHHDEQVSALREGDQRAAFAALQSEHARHHRPVCARERARRAAGRGREADQVGARQRLQSALERGHALRGQLPRARLCQVRRHGRRPRPRSHHWLLLHTLYEYASRFRANYFIIYNYQHNYYKRLSTNTVFFVIFKKVVRFYS